MSTVAPRNVNDISNVKRINDASHFSWQASCASFYVPGAVFGEVGGCVLLLCAL